MYGVAPYADRPYADVETIVGIALGRGIASASFNYTVYAATSTFATRADDSVIPSQPMRGTLETVLSFRRSIVGDSIGTFTTGDGTSVINNSDGAYDYLPQIFTADGRPYEVKVHRRGDDTSLDYTLFKGVMASWFIDEEAVAVQLRDFGYKLKVPALPNLYGGTGGADGGDEVAGKRKPRGIGRPRNVTALLINTPLQIYQVHDGNIAGLSTVYDRGVGLSPDADYPTYAALAAATIPAGSFATCLTQGLFRLNALTAGLVTADYETNIDTTANAIRYIVEGATALTYATDFHTLSFDNLNAEQPAPIDYWLGPGSTDTVADVVANLARGVGGWGGFRRDGSFEVRRFLAPTGAPLMYFSRADIVDIKRTALPSSLTPPPFRQRVAYALNWTVQDDLAGDVSSGRKAFLASASRLSEASADSIKTDHPFANDPEPSQTYFRNKVDADAEALRLLNLYRVERALYRITVPRKALYLDLGNPINVSYPRFDLSVGRTMIVVEISENLQRPRDGAVDTIEVVAYG